MRRKKRHWWWNLLIVVTVIACLLAFIAHYKNWTKVESDHLRLLSGIYYQELYYADLDSVLMAEKLPQMERLSGFSAWAKEKGVFKDSLHPENKVYVYVDDLTRAKIKVVKKDSVKYFLNFSDSLETQRYYEFLSNKLAEMSNTELP